MLAAAASIAATLVSAPVSEPSSGSPFIMSTADYQSGDVILRRADGWRNAVVASADTGSFGHVGIVVVTVAGPLVLHASPDQSRPILETVSRFLDPVFTQAAAVYRPDGSNGAAAAAAAMSLREISAGFDHGYNLDSEDFIYCTELVWRAYLAVGVDLGAGRRTGMRVFGHNYEVLLPSDLLSGNRGIIIAAGVLR